ncbi:MAG: HEAT repeat domain-containing protein [Bdellovibrionales bacterium]|nr:HEAT repeat domain-containing protein [Bdellovibrionales bacterium]
MKREIVAFLILSFSFGTRAGKLYSSLSLKEKMDIIKQIREQVTKKGLSNRADELYGLKEQSYSSSSTTLSAKDYRNIRMILGLPLENRKEALSNYGTNGFIVLKQLVFSNKETMPIRWKALTSLARLYPEKSLPIVLRALRDSTWFLRNAGLIAMDIIDPKEGMRWAGPLLNDSSLIVRTAAVSIIKKHKASQYKMQLLEKLNAPDSFYKNKSLWIRYHIVSALADFCEPGEEKMFISFLQDADEKLHSPAISALERLTGKTFPVSDEKGRTVASERQKQMWIKWWTKHTSHKTSVRL